MNQKIQPIELKDFLSQLLDQVETGVNIEERTIRDTIDIEVSIEKTKNVGGGIKMYVASGEAGSTNSQIAKVKFSVFPRESERSKRQTVEIMRHNEESASNWSY